MATHLRPIAALLALSLSALHASTAQAQERPSITHQFQPWLVVNYQGPLAGRLALVGDVQYRVWDDFTPQQVLVRQALVWWFTPRLFAGVGYAWTPSWRGRDATSFLDEHRIYQVLQYQYTHPATGFVLQLRTRIEQRFRVSDPGVEVGLRAREMVRALLPVAIDRRLSVVAWDEVFLHVTDGGGDGSPQWAFAGFDQNRAFVGLGFQVVPAVRLELGYLNQFIHRPYNPAGDLMSHTGLLQAFTAWR